MISAGDELDKAFVQDKCDRCGRDFDVDGEVHATVVARVTTVDQTDWSVRRLCDPCASFVDAAIAGRPCFSNGEPGHDGETWTNVRSSHVALVLDDDQVAHLAALGSKTTGTETNNAKSTAQAVLEHLAHSAIDGVRRPGSWERGWLHQAFGLDWEENLEQHPNVSYYQRPKR